MLETFPFTMTGLPTLYSWILIGFSLIWDKLNVLAILFHDSGYIIYHNSVGENKN